MWTPIQLAVTTFMSHLDTRYEFRQGVATMIYGRNEDDDAQESNGSGKSVLIEGVAMSLLGTPLRDVRAADLVMDGESALEITSTWKNTRSDDVMEIWRKVPLKGSSKLAIKYNGEDQSDAFPSVAEGNKFILDKLDITKEDLLNYFIISKEKYTSFFAFGDAKKKEVVARFSNANIIDPVFDAVKASVKQFDDDLRQLSNKEISISSKIDTLRDQLNNDGPDQEQVKKQKIEAIEDRLKNGRALILSKRAELDPAEKDLKQAQEIKDAFKEEDYDTKEASLKAAKTILEEDIQALKQDRKECDNFVHELEHIIAGTIECPNCSHKFVLGEDVNAEEAAKMLPEAKEALQEVINAIKEGDKSVSTADKKIVEVREKRRRQSNKKMELAQAVTKAKTKRDGVKYDIERFESALVDLEAELEGAKNIKIVDTKAPIRKNVKELEKQYGEVEKDVRLVEGLKANADEWDHKFKRFKSHLANKAISSIEAFTTHYLQQMNTNLGLQLSGYKMKTDGSLSEKITATVTRNGLPLASFGRFSGGEKVRVEVCNILALQGLINLNSSSGGLDLLCLDEIIESVDGKGVTELMKALSLLNKTVMVITHTNHSGVYEHIDVVVKKDGCSKIIRE